MKDRDKEDVIRLYYMDRYLPVSLARLYGVSHVTILNVLKKKREEDITIMNELGCQLCTLSSDNAEIRPFYIDGNHLNKSPQNIIMLCNACGRRIKPMQRRRHAGSIEPAIPQS